MRSYMIYDADGLKTEWSHKKQWVYQFYSFEIYGENVFLFRMFKSCSTNDQIYAVKMVEINHKQL